MNPIGKSLGTLLLRISMMRGFMSKQQTQKAPVTQQIVSSALIPMLQPRAFSKEVDETESPNTASSQSILYFASGFMRQGAFM